MSDDRLGCAALRSSVIVFALVSGCTFMKDPLRAGWLVDGVYVHPPPVCQDAPRRAYDDLATHPVPAFGEGDVDVDVDVPILGKVKAHLHGAGSVGPGVRVSSKATRSYRVLDERAVTAQVPGFVHRLDLRSFSRVAFVADASGWMCEGYVECPDSKQLGPAPPLLRREGDQIDAAVAGLRMDQSFVVITGAATRVMTYAPTTDFGRTLAGQFVRGQVCSGQRGVRAMLFQAVASSPEIIVLMTDGLTLPPGAREYEDKYGGCNSYPNDLNCQVDDKTEAVDVNAIAGGKPLPPVIAISVSRRDSKWMQNLAEATGGVYLDAP